MLPHSYTKPDIVPANFRYELLDDHSLLADINFVEVLDQETAEMPSGEVNAVATVPTFNRFKGVCRGCITLNDAKFYTVDTIELAQYHMLSK
jgi:hypothetical protein